MEITISSTSWWPRTMLSLRSTIFVKPLDDHINTVNSKTVGYLCKCSSSLFNEITDKEEIYSSDQLHFEQQNPFEDDEETPIIQSDQDVVKWLQDTFGTLATPLLPVFNGFLGHDLLRAVTRRYVMEADEHLQYPLTLVYHTLHPPFPCKLFSRSCVITDELTSSRCCARCQTLAISN